MLHFFRLFLPVSADASLIDRSLHSYMTVFVAIVIVLLAVMVAVLFPWSKKKTVISAEEDSESGETEKENR